MLSFTCTFIKHNTTSLGRAKGHNSRNHLTESQLEKSQWLDSIGYIVGKTWDENLSNFALNLRCRKDAVVAIEFSIQVGNQTDWRELPCKQFPAGQPKSKFPAKPNQILAAATEAVTAQFGAGNIICAAIHLDESTPHAHIIAIPNRNGKLQAKHWTGGAGRCAKLRRAIHAVFSRRIPCQYTPGAAGGAPHDKTKAAGKRGLLTQASDLLGLVAENKKNAALIADLNKQLQINFSNAKNHQRELQVAQRNAEIALEQKQMAERRLQLAESTIRNRFEIIIARLHAELDTLHHAFAALTEKYNSLGRQTKRTLEKQPH